MVEQLRARGLGDGGDKDTSERQRAAAKRRLILPLLLAFFYALATASMVFLLHNRSLIEEIGWWMFLGFWLLYAALMAALDRKRCLS